MDWIKQARLNTPSFVLGEPENDISELGGHGDEDDDDQVYEDVLGDDG
jgi:hypothetical protein